MNLFWYGVIASQLMGATSNPDPIKLDLQVEDSGYCRQGSTVMLSLQVRLIIRNRGDSPLIVSRIHRAATVRWTSAGERKRAKRIKLEGLLDLAFLAGEPPRRDLFEIVPAGGVFDASAALLRIPLKPGMLGRDYKITADFEAVPGEPAQERRLREEWRSFGTLLLDIPASDDIVFRVPRAPYIRPSCVITLKNPEWGVEAIPR